MNTYYSPFNSNEDENDAFRRQMYCLARAKEERRQIRHLGNLMGISVLCFVGVQIILSFIIYSNSTITSLYENSSVFQYCLNIIGVEFFALVVPFSVMALFNKKKYGGDLIPSKRIKGSELCLWVGFGMLCCVGADYIVGVLSMLSENMGYELTQSESLEPDSVVACALELIATAVVPAVCEEFAMRCCSLGLLKKHGKAFGVIAVSIVFGLIHGNIIQFIFATVVGLILGYLTVKTDSIVPAILVHGLNNSMSALASIFVLAFGEKAEDISTYAFFGFWIAAGLISTVILAFRKKLSFKLDAKNREPYANSLGQKVGAFISSPVLIISSLYLIYCVIASINKI